MASDIRADIVPALTLEEYRRRRDREAKQQVEVTTPPSGTRLA